MTNLSEVLEEQIQDLYNAENQLAKALKKMAKKASDPTLKQGFTKHLDETLVHADRLKQAAELIGIKPTGKACKAMKGLVEEGSEVLEEDGQNGAIDAALIAAAQRVEHYEIAAYGTVCQLAETLGHTKVKALLGKTLEEEKKTDEILTQAALTIYGKTPHTEDDEQEEEDEPMLKKVMKKTTKRM